MSLMKSTTVGSLRFHVPHTRIHLNLHRSHLHFSMAAFSASTQSISCGLRDGYRKPLWKSRVLSTEAIQAVQTLKLAKSSPRLENVFSSRLARLLKADLLDTLIELQRQNELELALKVFKFVRNEVWYKPDLSLYCGMILLLGKHRLIDMAEELFSDMKKEGLEPNTRAYTEMVGAYFQVDMIDRAMETYGLMKASGCAPDKLTFTILIRNLEKAGKEELAVTLKKEYAEYLDCPEKFLEERQWKHARN